ncbi:MAG: response regulator [Chloroflexi bacterium]|nr:response regulator [Chloroflexota bacterium]
MTNADYDLIIIDDETSVTDIFQQYILWKYTNWRFMTFNNSQIAYDAIINGRITAEVWIIDMMMPNKNGAEIAAAVREQQGSDPILLAYTALERRTLDTHEAYRSGMKHFNHIINKREDFTSILSLIEVWINQQA